MFIRVLLLFAIATLSACAAFAPNDDALKVNLSDMKMLESTLMEQRFKVKIRVQNRSRMALNVQGLSFNLELNDKDFASGVSDQQLTIEPLSESLLSVNLSSSLFALIRQFQSLQALDNEPFQYRLSGTIYTNDSAFGMPFSEQGEINLSKLAQDD